MKISHLIYFIFIVSILFTGCSKENLVGINSSSSRGGVSLSIKKNDVPSGVKQITAILSRLNYDTLKISKDVFLDSVNVLSFQDVSSGEWHLNVYASNADGKIIYYGATNVTIIEDNTIDIYLTLTPIASGIGNINIFINWSSLNNWIDYSGNPVFNPIDNFSPYGVTSPKILVEDSLFKMWYRQQDASGHSTIGYAISKDGINWTQPLDHPVLYRGSPDDWDSYAVTDGIVIKDGQYKMYYRGTNVHDGYAAIGLAFSSNGINWQKYQTPILIPEGEERAVGPENIIIVNNKYYLYYILYPNYIPQIGLAFSDDGINWDRYNGNPIMPPSQNWEGTGINSCSIIYKDGVFKMVYMNYENNIGFGKATSSDGIQWIKDNNNPYFTGLNTVNNWTTRPIYPCIINTGNNYRVYYNSSYISSTTAIGFLTITKF
jgi:predicted GH43/DUF377 family glycosyl hydrolase